jgi:hypothetical protein
VNSPGRALHGRHVPHFERDLDVVLNGEPRKQRHGLEDDRGMGIDAPHWGPTIEDLTVGRHLKPRDDPEERALAAAGGAEERDELALVDDEIDVAERGKRPLPAPIALAHSVELDQRPVQARHHSIRKRVSATR